LDSQVEAFWGQFCSTLPEGSDLTKRHHEAWYFCDNAKDAAEMAGLVRQGTKTATCGSLWAYEAEGERMPEVGDLSIITDYVGKPVLIIETTAVEVVPFDEVSAEHAYLEGEGDRSLAYWRELHWRVFSRELEALGLTPSEQMPLVCERFRMIYHA